MNLHRCGWKSLEVEVGRGGGGGVGEGEWVTSWMSFHGCHNR